MNDKVKQAYNDLIVAKLQEKDPIVFADITVRSSVLLGDKRNPCFHSVVLVWPKTGGFANVLGRHGGDKSCDAIIEEIIDLTVKEMSKKNDSTESSKALSTSLANLL